MKDGSVKNYFAKSALIGAAVAVFCGLLLWGTPLGDPWVNASYDYLFRFGTRAITNQILLVQMDEESYQQLHQQRGALWDRSLHTALLKKLAADSAALVVFDVFFKTEQSPESDSALADAIRQQGHVVLMADILDAGRPGLDRASVSQPQEIFLRAAAACGVGHASASTGQIVRQHWPFYVPGDGDFHSLGWAAASQMHAPFAGADQQWLRYYGEPGPWLAIPYHLALTEPPGFFRDKIIFVGGSPEKTDPGFPEKDKFLAPYTRWNGEAIGGMEIMATTFLNLVNGDWLRRPSAGSEMALLTLTGILIGGGLCRLKPRASRLPAIGIPLALAAGTFLAVTLVSVSWSYSTNYWFPWLIIAGGQLPCGLVCAWVLQTPRVQFFLERFPGYTTVGEPFGKGSYGTVRIVRNITDELQALKEIIRANPNFKDAGPYDREFYGIKNYKPFSNQHTGLLHIDHVNRNEREGYFYYVMELGDALDPDWQQKNESYKPRDLSSVCERSSGGRLPVRECLRIGIALLDALEFLHRNDLVHRDIKPSNVVFVNGQPKLADVGLVRHIKPEATIVGTPEYMPPEVPGTKAADIFAMGKLLYVISTGIDVCSFPVLSDELVENYDFMRLNQIICQACQPAADQRYASAGEMLAALRATLVEIEAAGTRVI